MYSSSTLTMTCNSASQNKPAMTDSNQRDAFASLFLFHRLQFRTNVVTLQSNTTNRTYMRKSLLLLVLIISAGIYAANRSNEAIQQIAQTTLQSNRKQALSHGRQHPSLQQPEILLETDMLAVVGYTDGGFAVISKDESNEAVLAYSDAILSDTLPEGYVWWMNAMSETLRKGNARRKVPASTKSVLPLIQTKWGQNFPYYNLCVFNIGGQNYQFVTGCVATTMAQIIKYYEYPQKGQGSNSYSVTYTNAGTLNVYSDFSSHTYDYEHMLNNYSNYLGEDSETSIKAVALLMSDCGISVNMKYNGQASSAFSNSIPNALVNNFSYSDKVQYIKRNNYSGDWMTLITNELDNNRPVIYSGDDADEGGHSFIIDGYDSEGLVHVNWGWGGAYDGYYDIDLLNPEDSQYSNSQDAVINIMPAKENHNEDAVKYGKYYYLLNPSDHTATLTYGNYKFTAANDIPSSITYNSQTYKVTAIGRNAFARTPLQSVNLPEGITETGTSAFAYTPLASITMPKSMRTIGENTFFACEKLTSVTLNDDLDSIAGSAFALSGIQQITIPDKVRRLQPKIFEDCASLQSVNLPPFELFYFSAFDGCSQLRTIILRQGLPQMWITNAANTMPFSECTIYVHKWYLEIAKYYWEKYGFKAILPLDDVGVTSVTLNKTQVTMKVGEEIELEATVMPADATDKEVSWYSSNMHVAIVDIDGIVTAMSPGKTVITATSADNPDCFAKCEITVVSDAYTVTLKVNDPVMGKVDGAGTYAAGSKATITATPNDGYKLTQWSDGSTSLQRTITVNRDIELTAIFEAKIYKLTLTCESDKGTVSGAGSYRYGSEVTIEARPKTGYRFEYWSDGDDTNPRSIIINGDISLEAVFLEEHTGIEAVSGQPSVVSPQKIMMGGHLYIIMPNGKIYDATGRLANDSNTSTL